MADSKIAYYGTGEFEVAVWRKPLSKKSDKEIIGAASDALKLIADHTAPPPMEAKPPDMEAADPK